MKDTLHVVYRGDRWVIKHARAAEDLLIAPTQSAAINVARAIAANEGVELVVFARNGWVQEEYPSVSGEPSRSVRFRSH